MKPFLQGANQAQRDRYASLVQQMLAEGSDPSRLDALIDEHAALCAEVEPEAFKAAETRALAAIARPKAQGDETVELDIYDIVGGGFFYGGVTAMAVRNRLKRSPNAKTIKVRMNSEGGDVFEGFAIYNLLNEHSARVEVDIDALAASIATVIAMAADEIRMSSAAWFMIHNPHGRFAGESKDLRRWADVLDGMAEQAAGIYSARTELAAEKVREMMDAETWLKASDAKELGFVDAVKPEKKRSKASAQLFASMSADDFSRVPDELRQRLEAAKGDEGDDEAGSTPAAAEPEATSDSPPQAAQEQLDLSPATPADTDDDNPPAPAAPEPSATADTGATRMANTKTPEVHALLAALSVESESELTSKIVLLNKFEAVTGKSGDAAYGVVLAWQEAAARVEKLSSKLVELKAKQEADEIEQAFEAAKAKKKLTPHLEATLRKQHEEGKMSSETITATLDALPINHALAANPKAAAAGSNDASTELRFSGKTYAEMSGIERDRLHKQDAELFNTMRQQALNAGQI